MWMQDMATMPTLRQLSSSYLWSSFTQTSRVETSGAKWTQEMHKSWHLPQRLRSSPISSHTDLEDMAVQDMAVQKKRQPQAWTLWRSVGQSTRVPLWWKMVLLITGASTMYIRVATMVYITITILRPRMSNRLQRNVEDERQIPQFQIQRYPHQKWSPT